MRFEGSAGLLIDTRVMMRPISCFGRETLLAYIVAPTDRPIKDCIASMLRTHATSAELFRIRQAELNVGTPYRTEHLVCRDDP